MSRIFFLNLFNFSSFVPANLSVASSFTLLIGLLLNKMFYFYFVTIPRLYTYFVVFYSFWGYYMGLLKKRNTNVTISIFELDYHNQYKLNVVAALLFWG